MKWIYNLPKIFLVIGAIVIGVFLIIFQSPPKNLCDIQKENYIDNQRGFLFPSKKNKTKKITTIQRTTKECRDSNSPEGCYSLFYYTTRLVQSIQTIHSKCHKKIAHIKEVKNAFFNIYSLFVEISWNDENSKINKTTSWLSINDIASYCKVRDRIHYLYGERRIEELDHDVHQNLASNQSLSDFKSNSILSKNCHLYPY